MSFSRQLTEDVIRKYDASDMRATIAAMSEHMRDGLQRASHGLASANLQRPYSNIILGGLGGSAIGGDLVRSYLGNDLSIPFEIVRGYELPASATASSLIIISSYSGNTEESLALFDQAIERGLTPVCITAGGKLLEEAQARKLTVIVLPQGFQPRAALAYSFVSVLMILQQAGLTSDENERIEKAAALCGELASKYQTLDGENEALALARSLLHAVPVIYSPSDILGSINVRWRGQIQENAKHFAFGSVLPEMNHNEINGWQHPHDLMQHFTAIMLRSPEDEYPRVQRRFEVLTEILRDKGVNVHSCEAQGSQRLSRMFSLIVLGDWVSFYLAMLTEVDPTPIPSIDRLKAALS
jgi:glucose/mannose-6-phosphate isomerase